MKNIEKIIYHVQNLLPKQEKVNFGYTNMVKFCSLVVPSIPWKLGYT